MSGKSGNFNRRTLVKSLGAMFLPATPFVLTACGGGGGDVDGSAPSTQTPEQLTPIASAKDQAIIFENDPNKRLLFLSSEDGSYTRYFGETDASGNLTEISRISYFSPSFDSSNPDAVETSFSVDFGTGEDSAIFDFGNGGTFEVKRDGEDYIFIITSADGSQIYTSTLNTLKASTPVSSATIYAASSETTVSYRGGQRIQIQPLAAGSGNHFYSHSDVASVATQKIELSVSNQCGTLKDGGAWAEVSPDSEYANKNIAGKLIVSPPVFVNLEYSAESKKFSGEAPLASLATDLDIVQKDALAFVQDQLEGKLKDLAILSATAAIGGLLIAFAPAIALPVSIVLSTKKVQFALKFVKSFQKWKDGAELAWDLGSDVYKALKTEGNYFPIVVQATYKGSLPEKTSKTVVNQPGLQTAQLSINYTDESGSTPKITKVSLHPQNPSQGQNYDVQFSVNCLESTDFTVRASVLGTDGYTDSEDYTISASTVYSLWVPGAETGVRDEVTIVLLQGGKEVDKKTASLVFGN